jgi:uncharacterized peroxidase-related enzyme
MAMAQGLTREQVKSILVDIDKTSLIDEKTRHILRFAEKLTRSAHQMTEDDINTLREVGCSDEDIFEAVAVTSLFNYMDRMADGLGAPVEGFQEMMTKMLKQSN